MEVSIWTVETHTLPLTGATRGMPGTGGCQFQAKTENHGRGFKAVMTVVLILVITMVMLLCMATIYIKNVIIPEASLEMADFNPNLTSTMYYKDPDTGNYEVMQTLYGSENRVWVDLSEIPKNLQKTPPWPSRTSDSMTTTEWTGFVPQKPSC